MDEASAYVSRAQEYQKAYYDRHHSDLELDVGAEVLLSTTYFSLPGSRKLRSRWIGPFPVLARVGPVAYCLGLPASYQMHNIFHISMLRPYDRSGDLRGPAPPAPVQNEGADEWEVDSILAHCVVGRYRSL